MKNKSILLFILLMAIFVASNVISCRKYVPENDGYSVWYEMTEVDSVIYAKARAAYLEDPENKGKAEYMIMQFLSHNPHAVRTKAVENGMNYQFACRDSYAVTVYKGTGDKVGKVIEINGGYDASRPTPPAPNPQKRDTLIY